MCLLVQAETPLALKNIEAIAKTEGVDGVFFGPSDLSASMGFRGQPSHPEVQKAIVHAITQVRAAGKAAGILVTDKKLAHEYLAHGANFVAVGVDTSLLVKAATDLAQSFKQATSNATMGDKVGTTGGY
jgi:4-hydroxy-2-oxoheptanedioate aldolase